MINQAMILAAGFGTRLKPWTDHHPKALARVNGKSLLRRNIQYLANAGIKNFVVNTHHFPEQIEAEVKAANGWGNNIQLIYENEILETGGGLLNAKKFLTEKYFIVMNVDILTDMDIRKMINFHLKNEPLVTLSVSERNSSRCFLFDNEGRLAGWKNRNTNEVKIKRDVENLKEFSFNGIHIVSRKIFENITREGKFSLVDWYLDLAADHRILAYLSNDQFLDVGKPGSIEKAESIFS